MNYSGIVDIYTFILDIEEMLLGVAVDIICPQSTIFVLGGYRLPPKLKLFISISAILCFNTLMR